MGIEMDKVVKLLYSVAAGLEQACVVYDSFRQPKDLPREQQQRAIGFHQSPQPTCSANKVH